MTLAKLSIDYGVLCRVFHALGAHTIFLLVYTRALTAATGGTRCWLWPSGGRTWPRSISWLLSVPPPRTPDGDRSDRHPTGAGPLRGFETCVEEMGRRLVAAGHAVRIYCRQWSVERDQQSD
jgi:hypothetical protein